MALENYETTRNAALEVYNDYVATITNENSNDWEINKKKQAILALPHYKLLIIQSSIKRWEELLKISDLKFRREICSKLFNLKQVDIMKELKLSSGAVSNLFHKSTKPNGPGPYHLSVLFNHPWQLINLENPNPFSYSESSEYFYDGVSKEIYLSHLVTEREKVRSIRGYVILNPYELFQQETLPIPGRWVTTYPEFDYFEFHLNYEPLINKVLRKGLLQLFPQAIHIITTYRPFKPKGKRSLWIIIPKNEATSSYKGILHELKKYRDDTEYHLLI